MARAVLLVLAVCATAALAVAWQDRQPAPAAPGDIPVFRARSELVVLHVTVFDRRGNAVAALPRHVFQVFEDDEPQAITFFSSGDVPVAAGLVIDNSGSMITHRRMVVAGATAFAESSHPEDELFTIHFNEHVRFGLPGSVPFTSERTLLHAALARYPSGGRTALHDAVIAGLEHLRHASHQKHVLVVLSDGDDNASRSSKADMLDRARRSNTVIYTVSNDRQTGTRGDPGVLRDLADDTGGVAYFPESEEEVVRSFDRIAVNIRRGYSIGYSPTPATRNGGFRRVKVVVRAPGRGHLKVRSRDGYLAPSAAGTG